jgi:hypothetical protein
MRISMLLSLGVYVVGFCVSCLVIFGAIRMKRRESYGIALTTAILSVIPCPSSCCGLGVPFGIWAIIVLCNSNVKAAFKS